MGAWQPRPIAERSRDTHMPEPGASGITDGTEGVPGARARRKVLGARSIAQRAPSGRFEMRTKEVQKRVSLVAKQKTMSKLASTPASVRLICGKITLSACGSKGGHKNNLRII